MTSSRAGALSFLLCQVSLACINCRSISIVVAPKGCGEGARVLMAWHDTGAFTPTCSSTHLPGYEAKYDEIKACGVEEIYCLSVNDAFVMRQW